MFGVKTTFSNSLFEGWVDTEFITFGKNVVVGQASHVQSAVIMGNFLIIRETVIEDDVRIGAHCVVMPGTHIGKNCMLGAESFTTVGQELEAGWIYLGVPAKKLKRNWFSDPDLEDELEHDLNMDVAEIRKLYEENFYVRHDEHHSILDRLTQDTNEPEE
jgi:carbonic anhydrase/acetyltransferase-like protein (isoleucine patch superfamily)